MYKMVQRLADFLPENEDVRIKKETVAQPVNTYIGILKLKLCMTAIQIFATLSRLYFDEKRIFQVSVQFDVHI